MPTTARYMVTCKNVPAIFQKIRDGVPPDKFNADHLKAIGFSSSNDRAIVPILKDLGFLSSDGTPTQRYKDYRNQSKSKEVLGEALIEAYPDVFRINENIGKSDRAQVAGLLKSLHDVSDTVADRQAATFYSLLDLANLDAVRSKSARVKAEDDVILDAPPASGKSIESSAARRVLDSMPLAYRFEIQLPATKDVEVFRAIFRAMREELFDV